MRPNTPVEQRLKTKIQKQENGCWMWTGVAVAGTPQIWLNRKMVAARPLISSVFKIDGKCHMKCGVCLCVNPEHLGTLDEMAWVRMLRRIVKKGECWEVRGQASDWYGKFQFRGKTANAHRIAYTMNIGEIPKGMFVCHRCDNPKCVRPEHLFLGSSRDNTQDCVYKRRHAFGVKNGEHKLVEEQVVFIREQLKAGQTGASLARMFDVTPTLITKIKKRKLWKHLRP